MKEIQIPEYWSWEETEKLNIEHWSKELLDMSFPTLWVELEKNEAQVLIYMYFMMNGEDGELSENDFNFSKGELEDKIKLTMEYEIEDIPFFVKLESRSPKDSGYVYKNGHKYLTFKDILNSLKDSERIYEEIAAAMHYDKKPKLYLRRWEIIPTNNEFRLFVVNSRLLAISQYFYKNIHKNDNSVEEIHHKIGEFWNKNRKYFPKNVVTDIFLDVWDSHVRLIEINPLCKITDPCLFSWKEIEDMANDKGQTVFRYNVLEKRDFRG